MAYRIKFDRSKCVGCYACHMACLDAHYIAEEENAVSFRTTVKFIDREKDFEKNICPGCILYADIKVRDCYGCACRFYANYSWGD